MRIALPVVTSVGVSADNVLLAMAFMVRGGGRLHQQDGAVKVRYGALRTFWYMSLN